DTVFPDISPYFRSNTLCKRLNALLIIYKNLLHCCQNKEQQYGGEGDAMTKDNVRDKIVEAAKKRFSHFGYGKTTMAEIATDCGMSPGNLYRFFPGKLDIAEAIASEDYETHLAQARKIALAPGKSARARLRDLLFAELRRTYQKLEKDPR